MLLKSLWDKIEKQKVKAKILSYLSAGLMCQIVEVENFFWGIDAHWGVAQWSTLVIECPL